MNEQESHNQKQFEILQFSLTERHTGAFGIIIYDDEHFKHKIHQQIQQQLANYKHITIQVAPHEITSLHRYLRENLSPEILQAKQVDHIIHVFDLSSSLVTYDYEKDRILPSRMLDQLNFERELLFRDFPFIILVWLDKIYKQTFAREAPDLWDWITYIFEFKTPEDEKTYEAIIHQSPFYDDEIYQNQLITIQDLKKRLKQLNKNTLNERALREEQNLNSLLAQAQFNAQLYEESIETYQKLIRLEEKTNNLSINKAELFLRIGQSYRKLRKLDQALEYLQKVLDLNTTEHQSLAYAGIGAIYEIMFKHNLAIENYQKALQHTSKNNLLRLGLLFRMLATSYHNIKYWQQALTHYQKALDYFIQEDNKPQIKKTYQQIALAYQEQGRTKLYELFAQKAQKTAPQINPEK